MVVSAVPPMVTWVFQIPTSPGAQAMLTWTMMAPGRGSVTEKRMSEMWATPTYPAFPTMTIRVGKLTFLNALPAPEMNSIQRSRVIGCTISLNWVSINSLDVDDLIS